MQRVRVPSLPPSLPFGLTDAHISGLDRGSGPTSVSRRRLAGRRTPGGEAAEFKREIEELEEIEEFMVTLGF
jgi:hypothetical protein